MRMMLIVKSSVKYIKLNIIKEKEWNLETVIFKISLLKFAKNVKMKTKLKI